MGRTVVDELSGADTIWLAQLRDRLCATVCFRDNDGIGLILLQASVIAFAWATLAEVALAGLAIALIYQSRGNNFKLWRVSWQRGKQLLQESGPLVLSSLAIFIYSKIDMIMLGSVDKTELGYYADAVKLSEICDLLPLIIASYI